MLVFIISWQGIFAGFPRKYGSLSSLLGRIKEMPEEGLRYFLEANKCLAVPSCQLVKKYILLSAKAPSCPDNFSQEIAANSCLLELH